MNFYTIESNCPNDNSDEILGIVRLLTHHQKNIVWLLSDLDIVPKYFGDYHPTGKKEPRLLVYNFMSKIQKEGFIAASFTELQDLLIETASIRRGVFLCVPDSTVLGDFYAHVEPQNIDAFQHECAFHEVRVLDE
ncbi:hypothetical protein SK3146_01330 [Paenibacillus konkukensis]|uniref:Uncharacterized protein n=1 Tax=Paenibacillus konkukensis TaxID=2020716 RepID=A0ABY4RJ22_9BACL|nr:hypothetical protein [Paenibacillus konkukensis]UQZ82173.1 hypothetical protein SK3146_01330 [Paenibacillus konkukensis]